MSNRFFCTLFGVLLGLSALLIPTEATAQPEARCFPETGQCIRGRIRSFWERNGGLPVFGFPLSPQYPMSVEGQNYQVQEFERTRLEIHPDNPQPYDVLMGRLGVERLQYQGRDWRQFPRSEPQPGCRFFAETGQQICGPFLNAWQSNGLQLDDQPGVSEAESLALFGLPISGERTEELEGRSYTVQWFERARFELHPDLGPNTVLFGRLGAEINTSGAGSPVNLVDRTQDFQGLGFPDQRKIVRDRNGVLYVAYRKRYEDVYRIFVARSTNNGASWSVLNDDRPIEDVGAYTQRVPTIAVGTDNTLHVAWYGPDARHPDENNRQIKYVQSRDGGATWSPWVHVAEVPGHTDEGRWQEHPALAVRGEAVTIAWEGADPQSDGEEQIKLVRSTDGGRTWSNWQNVGATPGNGYSRPTVVERSDGTLYLLAYAERDQGRQIVWTVSADGGQSWQPWAGVAPSSSDQRHVSLAIDANGRLHAVWRQQIAGANTQVVYAGYDGATWSAPEVISPNERFQFFPSIAAIGTDTVYVVWTETADGANYPQDNPEIGQIVGSSRRTGQGWSPPLVLNPAGQSAVYATLSRGGPAGTDVVDVVWMDTTDPRNRFIRHTAFTVRR